MLGVLVLVLAGLLVRAARQIKATPDYWQDNRAFIEQTPEPQLDQIARSVENRLPTEWTRPVAAGDGVRTIRVHYDEVNAWLALRLPEFLKNQNIALPREVGQFMLTQRDGDLVVAFDYESNRFGPNVASVFFEFKPPPEDVPPESVPPKDADPEDAPPEDADSEDAVAGASNAPLQARIHRAYAGEQYLPVGTLLKTMRKQILAKDPDLGPTLDALRRRRFVDLPPLPIDDHRQATVLGIEIGPQAIDVTVRVRYNRDVEAE